MAKGRVSLKKSAATKTTAQTKPESLSLEKQEEIVQKANLSSVEPKKSTQKPLQRLTIDIPAELHQKLKRIKQEQGITSRGLIIRLLREHFQQETA